MDTYPWAEEDALSAALIARIDAREDAEAALRGREEPSYQSALSIPPGSA
ncbi:hypothetical protein ACFYYS_03815 [Streptomyces sp. NPDC002120]